MARFQYQGEPPVPWIKKYGETLKIAVPQNGKSPMVFTKPSPGFVAGDVLPYDFTDERSIASLRQNPRFREV